MSFCFTLIHKSDFTLYLNSHFIFRTRHSYQQHALSEQNSRNFHLPRLFHCFTSRLAYNTTLNHSKFSSFSFIKEFCCFVVAEFLERSRKRLRNLHFVKWFLRESRTKVGRWHKLRGKVFFKQMRA